MQRLSRSTGRAGCYDITAGRSKVEVGDQETEVWQLGSDLEPEAKRSTLGAAD